MSVPYTPHEYQLRAIKFGVSHAVAAFFLDPGLGKTSIIYAMFCALKKAHHVNKMLVIAPLRPAESTWPAEAKKWADFTHLRVVVLHGKDKEKLLNSDADVYVINPEGLRWLFLQMKGKRVPWEMLVVDESTRFKHANTDRFKTLKPWLTYFQRRYILTGSPAPNGLLDLFGQVYLLDLGLALGQYISHYRMNYFDQVGYGGYTYVPRRGAPEAIHEKLKPYALRMAAEDYLKLPPLIENTIEIDLPDKAMAAYRQMEAMLIASVEEDVITAANAAAATGKCRQIANGGIYHEDGQWTHIHEAKLDAVEEIVEELQGTPALIAYEYKHDLERLQKRFPGAPHIGGGVSTKVFKEIEEAWNFGAIPVLLAQPQSVAHGLNLQGTAGHIVWHSLTWDLEVREQFIRRVWRQGQQHRVLCHNIVARGTVDEIIMKMIGKKDRTQQQLLTALKSHYRRRAA